MLNQQIQMPISDFHSSSFPTFAQSSQTAAQEQDNPFLAAIRKQTGIVLILDGRHYKIKETTGSPGAVK